MVFVSPIFAILDFSDRLLGSRKGRALPQAQPFLHSFRGCVYWAETFSLGADVSSPHSGNALSANILFHVHYLSILKALALFLLW